MPILTSFAALHKAVAAGVAAYLDGKVVESHRDGIHHGSTGKHRAQLAQTFLSWLTYANAGDEKDLLALALAIFKPNKSADTGRSSRLASLIADQSITGSQGGIALSGFVWNSLASTVFEEDALKRAKSKTDCSDIFTNSRGGGHWVFNSTKAMRYLLKLQRKEHYLAPEQASIKANTKRLIAILDSDKAVSEMEDQLRTCLTRNQLRGEGEFFDLEREVKKTANKHDDSKGDDAPAPAFPRSKTTSHNLGFNRSLTLGFMSDSPDEARAKLAAASVGAADKKSVGSAAAGMPAVRLREPMSRGPAPAKAPVRDTERPKLSSVAGGVRLGS